MSNCRENSRALCCGVNCVCEKIFEFEFFVKYCAWAVVCSNFNTCVKYQNSMILCKNALTLTFNNMYFDNMYFNH